MNEIEPALRRAYALGQKYWQQADSDFARDHRKADETQAKFNQLVESMQGWLSPAEADNLRTQLAEAQKDAALAQALQQAAKDLPAHFVISVNVDRDAEWVELYNRYGYITEIALEDLTLAETLRAAFDIAINAKQGESNGSN